MEQTLEGSKKNRTIKKEKKISRRSRRNENLLRLLSHLASVVCRRILDVDVFVVVVFATKDFSCPRFLLLKELLLM